VQVLGAGGVGVLYLIPHSVPVTSITFDGSRNVVLVLNEEAANVTVEMSLNLSDPEGWAEVTADVVSPNTLSISAAAHGNAPAAFFRVSKK
jgi:hypothetical protein